MIVKVKIDDAVQATVKNETVANAFSKSVRNEEEEKVYNEFKDNMEKEAIIFFNKNEKVVF